MDDQDAESGRIELNRVGSPEQGWEVTISLQDGYYHVKAITGSKEFNKFYKDGQLAWRCFYDKWTQYHNAEA